MSCFSISVSLFKQSGWSAWLASQAGHFPLLLPGKWTVGTVPGGGKGVSGWHAQRDGEFRGNQERVGWSHLLALRRKDQKEAQSHYFIHSATHPFVKSRNQAHYRYWAHKWKEIASPRKEFKVEKQRFSHKWNIVKNAVFWLGWFEKVIWCFLYFSS